MSHGSWTELFRAKASVYALDEDTKQWVDRGTSGVLILYLNSQNRKDVRIKWEKSASASANKQVWWRLTSSKLKSKGERALVLKAWATATNEQEILAIRFGDQRSAQYFSAKYHAIFPSVSYSNGSQQDMASYNDYSGYYQSPPPPPPDNDKRKAPVKALPDMKPPTVESVSQRQSHYISNGQIVNPQVVHNYLPPPKQDKHWQCAVCTYQNEGLHIKCAMCGLPNAPTRVNRLASYDSDLNVWSDQDQESVYDHDTSSIYDQRADLGPWRCRSCTFSNRSWFQRCEVCSAKRFVQESMSKQIRYEKSAEKAKNAQELHQELMMDCFNQDSEFDSDIGIASPIYNSIPPQKFEFDQNAQDKAHNMSGNANHGTWSCPLCTLVNSFENARCEACNTARNRVNPYGMGGMDMDCNHSNQFDDYNYSQHYIMNQMGNSNANNRSVDIEDFSRAASDIACFNDKPVNVFSTLRSVAKKLLKENIRYRTLDTTNPKVMERLIGYEGVLDFLMLLGFESDAMGMKLICKQRPHEMIVHNAINVLNTYQQRFRMTNGFNMASIANQFQHKDNVLSDDNITIGGDEDEYDDDYKGNRKKSDENGGNSVNNDILTLEQIIVWSTHENMQDNDTMETLIMTHKLFTDSITLLRQLRKRFFVKIPNFEKNKENEIKNFQSIIQKRIHLKVIKALRDWMKHYWDEDFYENEEMHQEMNEWLRELSNFNSLEDYNVYCTWVSPLYATVRKEFERLLRKEKKELVLVHKPNLDHILIPKKFQISQISAEEIADQITLMDYRIFSKIESRECLHQRWKDPDNIRMAPNVLSLIQQFNNFTIFVQIQVLRERSLVKRGKAIKRLIKMGEHFRHSRNFNSLCAVFSALNTAPIHRLKLAWRKVPDKLTQTFEEWNVIFCRDFNHRNLRQSLRKSGGHACIPHIGVFLQDLVFIDEGNQSKIEMESFGDQKIINFNKCVRLADRIKNLQLFQNQQYKIKTNELIQKLLYDEFDKLKDVTEDQIWDMSTEIKKQDHREAKNAWNIRNNMNKKK